MDRTSAWQTYSPEGAPGTHTAWNTHSPVIVSPIPPKKTKTSPATISFSYSKLLLMFWNLHYDYINVLHIVTGVHKVTLPAQNTYRDTAWLLHIPEEGKGFTRKRLELVTDSFNQLWISSELFPASNKKAFCVENCDRNNNNLKLENRPKRTPNNPQRKLYKHVPGAE